MFQSRRLDPPGRLLAPTFASACSLPSGTCEVDIHSACHHDKGRVLRDKCITESRTEVIIPESSCGGPVRDTAHTPKASNSDDSARRRRAIGSTRWPGALHGRTVEGPHGDDSGARRT